MYFIHKSIAFIIHWIYSLQCFNQSINFYEFSICLYVIFKAFKLFIKNDKDINNFNI